MRRGYRIWGLFALTTLLVCASVIYEAAALTIETHEPNCKNGVCTIPEEHMKGIIAFQAVMEATIEEQRAEIKRLRRVCPERAS